MVVSGVGRFLLVCVVFVARASSTTADDSVLVRLPRQPHDKRGQQDQSSAETGFLGGGGVENSKYFQDIYVLRPDPMEIEFGHVFENPHEWEQRYEKKDFNKNRHQGKRETFCGEGQTATTLYTNAFHPKETIYQHLPEHDKYEFGHRRGNEHHVIERYEKAIPHEGQFKTKVRWADKKGGHGEHYWDYNHAGHDGHGGNGEGDKNGGYSDPVPAYSPIAKAPKYHQKRQLEHERQITLEDVESPKFESKERAAATTRDDLEKERVEKYDIQKEAAKQKRNSGKVKNHETIPHEDSHLFFDITSGEVVDELTGKKYILQPVN